jgi:hypothetical protein
VLALALSEHSTSATPSFPSHLTTTPQKSVKIRN